MVGHPHRDALELVPAAAQRADRSRSARAVPRPRWRPSATMHFGCTTPTSARMKGRQAAISSSVGLRLLVVWLSMAGRNLQMFEM